MTSNQLSRVLDGDLTTKKQGQSSAMASREASRRTSRTSSCEDMHSAMASSSKPQAIDDTKKDEQAPLEMASYGHSVDVDLPRYGVSDTSSTASSQRTSCKDPLPVFTCQDH